MQIIYNLIIWAYYQLIRHVAISNPKAKKFIEGRHNLLPQLINWRKGNEPLIWFHCASLGEFEQVRPLIEELRKHLPNHLFLLTFYSPSGYEVRKDYDGVDHVTYLPIDLPDRARQFINAARPQLVVLVKYEFWINHLNVLNQKSIPVISVSSIFRESQIIFGALGRLHRKALRTIEHFFVQNTKSIKLLNSINIDCTTVSGDTRFDRVNHIANVAREFNFVREFKGAKTIWIIGSSWQKDLEVLAPFINKETGCKFIIAPHETNDKTLTSAEALIARSCVRYSKIEAQALSSIDVIIIDNVGMLSSLYKSADYAYVGGAFGGGLHNILEASAQGMPIFFGNKNFKKFQEATDLVAEGVAFPIGSAEQLIEHFKNVQMEEKHSEISSKAKSYVAARTGATQLIASHILNLLK